MEFALFGASGAKDIIKDLGGRVVTFINQRTKAVIADEGNKTRFILKFNCNGLCGKFSESMKVARDTKNKRLNFVEQHLTPVVGIEFLEQVQCGNRNIKKLLKECDMTTEWLYVSLTKL